jgi:predicted DNA-binding transcriptional regulator YafY
MGKENAMKMKRLVGITIYLLNHNTVPARELAGCFKVPQRTIARDIEAFTHSMQQ